MAYVCQLAHAEPKFWGRAEDAGTLLARSATMARSGEELDMAPKGSMLTPPGLDLDWSQLLPAKVVPLMSPPTGGKHRLFASAWQHAPQDEEPTSSDESLPSSDSSECFFDVLRSGSETDCLEVIQSASVQVLNKADADRRTALHHAVRRRLPEVIRALLSRSDFEAMQVWDSDGETAMHRAVRQGDVDSCLVILEVDATMALAENSSGETAAEVAMCLGNRSIIKAFQACRRSHR
eukprot:TRINITY_DN33897_c0_g1_i2.p1 TRINITY_DN33897_c0_g1~~TRINITY_DN33897_c0_g1_i2.p1  ORF type:complete len:236 (+),score=48.48 TRINITY_DN33897_c0_g1_i2:106-813(+)